MENLVSNNPNIIMWVLSISGTIITGLITLLALAAKTTLKELKDAITALNNTLSEVSNEFKSRDHVLDKRISRVERTCALRHDVEYPDIREQ